MIYKIAHKLPSLGVIVQMSTLGLYPVSYYGQVGNGSGVDVFGIDKNKEPDSLKSGSLFQATHTRRPPGYAPPLV